MKLIVLTILVVCGLHSVSAATTGKCYDTQNRDSDPDNWKQFGSTDSVAEAINLCHDYKYTAFECPQGGKTEVVCFNDLSGLTVIDDGECNGNPTNAINGENKNGHCDGTSIIDGLPAGGWHRAYIVNSGEQVSTGVLACPSCQVNEHHQIIVSHRATGLTEDHRDTKHTCKKTGDECSCTCEVDESKFTTTDGSCRRDGDKFEHISSTTLNHKYLCERECEKNSECTAVSYSSTITGGNCFLYKGAGYSGNADTDFKCMVKKID